MHVSGGIKLGKSKSRHLELRQSKWSVLGGRGAPKTSGTRGLSVGQESECNLELSPRGQKFDLGVPWWYGHVTAADTLLGRSPKKRLPAHLVCGQQGHLVVQKGRGERGAVKRTQRLPGIEGA